MEPKSEHLDKIDHFCNKYKIKHRIFTLPVHLQSFREETQLRMEITDINPIGVVILNATKDNFSHHKEFIAQDVLKRLYENANTTYMTNNDSGIHPSRLQDHDESYEDLTGYENIPITRNFSKNSNYKGIYLIII